MTFCFQNWSKFLKEQIHFFHSFHIPSDEQLSNQRINSWSSCILKPSNAWGLHSTEAAKLDDFHPWHKAGRCDTAARRNPPFFSILNWSISQMFIYPFRQKPFVPRRLSIVRHRTASWELHHTASLDTTSTMIEGDCPLSVSLCLCVRYCKYLQIPTAAKWPHLTIDFPTSYKWKWNNGEFQDLRKLFWPRFRT